MCLFNESNAYSKIKSNFLLTVNLCTPLCVHSPMKITKTLLLHVTKVKCLCHSPGLIFCCFCLIFFFFFLLKIIITKACWQWHHECMLSERYYFKTIQYARPSYTYWKIIVAEVIMETFDTDHLGIWSLRKKNQKPKIIKIWLAMKQWVLS